MKLVVDYTQLWASHYLKSRPIIEGTSWSTCRVISTAGEEADQTMAEVTTGAGTGTDTPPNMTIYINNINEKIKLDGAFLFFFFFFLLYLFIYFIFS